MTSSNYGMLAALCLVVGVCIVGLIVDLDRTRSQRNSAYRLLDKAELHNSLKANNMRILIIFEEVPDSTKFAAIDNPTEDQLRILRASQNQFINGHDWPEQDELSALFYDSEGRFENAPIQLSEISGTPIEGPFDLVFYTGFIL